MKINSPFNLIILIVFTVCSFSHAQNLSPGDIAFVGYNSVNPDGFTIIALTNIPVDEIVYFTDNGWLSSGDFRGGEGIITWENTGSEIITGTIITFIDNGIYESSIGTVTNSGNVSLALEGDQLIAYYTDDTTITNISAIHFKSDTWNSDATNSNTSAIPAGLINDSTAMAIGNIDNAIYVGNFNGTQSELQAKIYNPANWFNSSLQLVISADYFPCDVFIEQTEEWNLATNWFGNEIPNSNTNVLIPEQNTVIINDGTSAACKNMIIYPRGTLTVSENNTLSVNGNIEIKSRTSSYSGNLINKGTLTVSGNTTLERYIPSTNWHIISSPVSDQEIGEFVLSNPIDSFTHDNITDYDLTFYNELTNDWDSYTLSTEKTALQICRGYSARKTVNSGAGTVTFTGTLNSGNITVSVTKNNFGWNCIGNPYPSVLNIANSNGFLDKNLGALDPLFSGIYVWNESIADYEVITKIAYNFSPPGGEDLISQNNIAPAQGFFIKAKENGEIYFTPDLQNSTETSFKSAETTWPAIQLISTLNHHTNSTIIAFNEQMTTGIDPMYDVGKFCGNPDFSLSSKTSSNSDLKLSVQALPLSSITNCTIPLEVNSSTSGHIEFKTNTSNLPHDVLLYLNDTKLGKVESIDSEHTYSTQFETNEPNRFFLQLSSTTDLKKPEEQLPYRITSSDEYFYFNSNSLETFSVKIYSIDGKLCFWEPNYQGKTPILKSNFKNAYYAFLIENENISHKGKILIKKPFN